MPAYMVFIRERLRHREDFAVYEAAAPATLAGHEVTPLAVYSACETLEGGEVDGAVILQFPTVAAARAWYDGPAYREARVNRFKGADYRVFLTEGL